VVFKGGTYLWFFGGLDRFSEDLDFTQNGKISPNIPDIVSRDLELYGIENEMKIMKDDDLGLSFRIAALGPLHTSDKDRCFVYVEISRREPVILKQVPLKLDFPEYQLQVHRIPGMALQEVGSEKVRAILTRKKARDIYDLHYLVTRKGIGFDQDLIDEKLRFYQNIFSAKEFVDQLESREKQFKRELVGTVFGELPEYSSVVETLRKWINETGK
jgi:predicted nucleotidyltransferase component of viral defense system